MSDLTGRAEADQILDSTFSHEFSVGRPRGKRGEAKVETKGVDAE
jgi:hypothetical protein